MRVAALDLGSNTSLLLIADIEADSIRQVVLDRTTITKLGQGVHADRRFHPDALNRMRACLLEYHQLIQQFRCDRVVAVATSAARDVSNGHELIAIGKEVGIPIQIISGDREAELTFKGALFDQSDTRGCVVIDVGGGSTEIMVHAASGIQGTSVNVGSVRLTELFVQEDPIGAGAMESIRNYVSHAFENAGIPRGPFQKIIAVAGTPTTLAALDQKTDYIEEKIHGYSLAYVTIQKWIDKMSNMKLGERRQLPGMQPGREDVIVVGSIILATALHYLGGTQLVVSTRGVRYGIALNWKDF